MGERILDETRDDAFHVTAVANVTSIAAHGFRVDRRGVLGSGAYFDLGTDSTGWAPARKRFPGQTLVVLRCSVALGRVLDLDDGEVRARLRGFQRELVQEIGRERALASGQGGHIDLLLQALFDAGEAYHSVRRTFARDGQTRVAIRESWRIRVISASSEQGEALPWPPTDD